jgi:hypothetical protein
MVGRLRGKRALPGREVFTLKDEHVARIEIASKKDAHPDIVQFRANAAWFDVGRELGFDARTVAPVDPSDCRHVTAIPLPNDERNGGGILLPSVRRHP